MFLELQYVGSDLEAGESVPGIRPAMMIWTPLFQGASVILTSETVSKVPKKKRSL